MRYIVASVIFLALFISGFKRNEVWKSPVSLWSDTAWKSPVKPRVHNNLGMAYERIGWYAEAMEHFKKSIELDPKYHAPYLNLGNIYVIEGRLSEAEWAYRKVIQLNPDNPKAYFNLALIYLSAGDKELAEYYFRKAFEVDPTYEIARKFLNYIYDRN
jgi:Flp pilus assembly protein TadD